jgi:hypothetical protein
MDKNFVYLNGRFFFTENNLSPSNDLFSILTKTNSIPPHNAE